MVDNTYWKIRKQLEESELKKPKWQRVSRSPQERKIEEREQRSKINTEESERITKRKQVYGDTIERIQGQRTARAQFPFMSVRNCACLDKIVKAEIVNSNLNPHLKGAFMNVRTCSDVIPIEQFYDILVNTVNNMDFSSRPIIYKVRNAVTKRTGITDEEFNRYLFQTVSNGWVTLIEGSPVSGKESNWYDISGRRFYYLDLKRGNVRSHKRKPNFLSIDIKPIRLF